MLAKGAASVGQFVNVWRDRTEPRSQGTIKAAERWLQRLVDFTLKAPDQITPADVRAFRSQLESLPIKRESARTALSKIATIYGHAVDAGLIDDNPCAGIRVHITRSEREADAAKDKSLTPVQVQTLLAALCKLPHDDFRVLVRSMLYHAMRAAEVANLTKADLTTVDGIRCFSIHDAKTVASTRIVPLHAACEDVWQRLIRSPAGHLFIGSNAVTRVRRFQNELNPFLKSLELLPLHSLRHTWKNRAQSINMPVEISAKTMGHRLPGIHHAYGGTPAMKTLHDWLNRVDPLA